MSNASINAVNDCEHDAGPPPHQALPIGRDLWAVWCVKCHGWQEITNGPTSPSSGSGDA